MRAPTSWRITCAASASGPRPWSGCASSARWRCWSGCSASSRPAAPICRSTRTIRPSGSPSCWRMPAPPVLVTHAGAASTRLPATHRRLASCVRLDADWPADRARSPPPRPPLDARPAQPRLRHLHLGLDRNAEGRGRRRMAILSNFLTRWREQLPLEPDDRLLAVTHPRLRHRRRSRLCCRCSPAPLVVLRRDDRAGRSGSLRAASWRARRHLMQATADVLAALIADGAAACTISQRLAMLVGGEALPAELARALARIEAAARHQSLWPDRRHDDLGRLCCWIVGAADDAVRSGGRSGTRGFTSWTAVWSLCLLGLRVSFTSRGWVWRGAIWTVRV